jgi:integrase
MQPGPLTGQDQLRQARTIKDHLATTPAQGPVSASAFTRTGSGTFAVELEDAGTPVTVISKLLGHSRVAVTARYLDHLANSQAVTALENTELPPIAPA